LAEEFPDFAYSVVELPTGASRRSTVVFAACWAVSSRAPDPQAVLRLAAFLTTPAANQAWAAASGTLPPSLDQARAWLPPHAAYAPFVAGLDYAVPWAGPPGFAATMDPVNSLLAAAVKGEASAADVIARLQAPAASPTPTGAAPED
jgi:multiple sugar transport system substrate-binding protein